MIWNSLGLYLWSSFSCRSFITKTICCCWIFVGALFLWTVCVFTSKLQVNLSNTFILDLAWPEKKRSLNSIEIYHYELQCYENPMKMSLGPWIQIFHFHGLFFRPWIFYEKLIMGFMAHEIAMKYLALGFMSHEKLVCYRFHGPWKLHSEISGVVKNEKW